MMIQTERKSFVPRGEIGESEKRNGKDFNGKWVKKKKGKKEEEDESILFPLMMMVLMMILFSVFPFQDPFFSHS